MAAGTGAEGFKPGPDHASNDIIVPSAEAAMTFAPDLDSEEWKAAETRVTPLLLQVAFGNPQANRHYLEQLGYDVDEIIKRHRNQ